MSSGPPPPRDLDIALFGATGFVGRLIADHLAQHAPPDVRIGLAGRSKERLEQLRAQLPASGRDWPLLVADASDPASMRDLAGAARVVATTVGPYARYGLPVVEACVSAGTDYADLTGEVLFARQSADRFHDRAEDARVRIVHACGFDSIPSDLGVLALAEHVRADGEGELGETTLLVRSMKGGLSGGTIDSARTQVDAMRSEPALRRVAVDPYALSPDRAGEPEPGDGPDQMGVRHDEELQTWTGPFVMASFNTRIVRRSNALTGWSYGRGFRYREVRAFGQGVRGRLKATATAAGLGAGLLGMALRPTRMVLDRVLPDPGEGPSEKARREGRLRIDIHTVTSTGARYRAVVTAQGDPGYAATSVMFGQASLCLAQDTDRLPPAAGVLTPATAMGMVLVERLRAAGMGFDVERI